MTFFTATGSHQRIRLSQIGIGVHLHATVCDYDFKTNVMKVWFDVQPAPTTGNGVVPFVLTPVANEKHKYTDQNNIVWDVIQ